MSVFADYPPNLTSIRLGITTTANGVNVGHAVPVIQRDVGPDRVHAIWGSTVALYADPGTEVVFQVVVSGMVFNDITFVTPKVSGYLVETEP